MNAPRRLHKLGCVMDLPIVQALLALSGKEWVVLFFGFFGGGLAGASFNQIIGWIRRPKLRLCFSSNVNGCIVDPPGYVLGPDGKPLLDASQNPIVVATRYLRVMIQNTGRTVAHGVIVSVTKLTYWRQTTGSEVFDEEVMDLPVVRHSQQLDLPPGAHRYMDVFSAWNYNGPRFRFSFVELTDRIYLREYHFGSYKADIIATANNISKAKTAPNSLALGSAWCHHPALIAPQGYPEHPSAVLCVEETGGHRIFAP